MVETREDALLTMRVARHPGKEDLILRSIAKRCVSKDEAIEVALLCVFERSGYRFA